MFLLTLILAGCAQQQAADAPAEPVAIQPVAITPVQPLAPEPIPVAPAPRPSFAFADDLTGKELARVVKPSAPPVPSTERLGTAPQSRPVPANVLEPDLTTRAKYIPPPVMPIAPVIAAKTPAPPPETVPLNLGAGADGVPAKPVLPVAAVVTERVRDVNLPPPLPTLGRPVTDRVSLEDPTSDFGNAVIVAGSAKAPVNPSGFLKVTVPDPFELGSQVKPKVPPTAEPSATPVPVNPQRPK